jgi:hypothetical protein
MLDAVRLVWAIVSAVVSIPDTPKEPPCQPSQQCEAKK